MAKKSRRKPARAHAPTELFNARSVLSDVVWPGSGSANTNIVLAFLYQLQLSQWWSQADLALAGLRQLREIVTFAAGNALYRERFEAAGITAAAPFSAAQWQQCGPCGETGLDRLARNGPLAIPPSHGGDAPIVWRDGTRTPALRRSAITAFFDAALRLRELQWHARDPGAAVVVVDADRPGSPTSVAGRDGWDTALGCLATTANRITVAEPATAATVFAALRRSGADILECSTATLAALVAAASDAKVPQLRLVRVHGEVPSAALRSAASTAFGAVVRLHLAHALTGAIAFECAERGALHVQAENVYVELVDAHGGAVAKDAAGRLLVTDLHNLRQPVPRFDTGWTARWGATCGCGRGLPVLELPPGQSA